MGGQTRVRDRCARSTHPENSTSTSTPGHRSSDDGDHVEPFSLVGHNARCTTTPISSTAAMPKQPIRIAESDDHVEETEDEGKGTEERRVNVKIQKYYFTIEGIFHYRNYSFP